MEYRIEGGNMPVVICKLEANEKMITQGGGMSWMSSNMKMETTAGGFGKAFGRLFSGENMFQNIYTSVGKSGMIAFASSFPGNIRAFRLEPGNDMILQKSAFLASEEGVELSVFFNKKVSGGIFGGEGFIMQRVSGNGIVFAEFDGSIIEYDLAAGQQLVIDTGHLAAMSATCSIDVQMIQGAKNIFFGGEGLFNTVVTGPGKVYLQTMPIVNMANRISVYIPTSSN